jgi:hypothetical protein
VSFPLRALGPGGLFHHSLGGHVAKKRKAKKAAKKTGRKKK